MPKGNNRDAADLLRKLEDARRLLDEAINFVGGRAVHKGPSRPQSANRAGQTRLDFSMSSRAFIKANSKGMSGAKKLALLVAYLAKGDPATGVSTADITSSWSRLTGVLGMKFNPALAVRARENDWVHTAKTGVYHLRPNWKAIFQ